MMPPLPTDGAVASLLTTLVGQAVKVKKSAALVKPAPGGGPVFAGIMVDRESIPVGAFLCDYVFACTVAGLLSGFGAVAIQDAMKEKSPSPAMIENVREIFNVATSMFNQGERHLRLAEVFTLGATPPPSLAAASAAPCKRFDFEVTAGVLPAGKIAALLKG